MTDERDPVRWLDATSDCDPALRRVLDTAREGLGDGARADALARGIEQAVHARVAADGEPGLGSLRARGLRRWLPGVGIAGVIAGLGAAAWSSWSAAPASDARATAAPAATSEAPVSALGSTRGPALRLRAAQGTPGPEAAEPAAATRTAGADAVTPTALPEGVVEMRAARSAERASESTEATARVDATTAGRARSRPRDPRSKVGGAPSAVNSASGATSATGVAPAQTEVPPELQLLSAAQRALRAAPADALALADSHARAYPSGRFAPEREEIAITALFALGDRAAGRARARAFLARYPRSLAASRIASLLED